MSIQHGPDALLETHRAGGRAGYRYKVEALIEAVLLADLVRNSDTLLELIERSVRLYLGGDQQDLLSPLLSACVFVMLHICMCVHIYSLIFHFLVYVQGYSF